MCVSKTKICLSWFKEGKHTHRSGFANITNVVLSFQCILIQKESRHTHRSSFVNICCNLPFNVLYILIDSKKATIEVVLSILPMLYLSRVPVYHSAGGRLFTFSLSHVDRLLLIHKKVTQKTIVPDWGRLRPLLHLKGLAMGIFWLLFVCLFVCLFSEFVV